MRKVLASTTLFAAALLSLPAGSPGPTRPAAAVRALEVEEPVTIATTTPVPVVIVESIVTTTTTTTVPIQATPAVPVHDGRPQAAAGQTVDDATVIPDDGFGYPVETGHSEIARLGDVYDTSDLAEVCEAKPWLCE